MITEVGFQPRQNNQCGTKVPPPEEHNIKVKNGSGALAPQKENVKLIEAGLKSHLQRNDNIGGIKVPLPKYSHLQHINLEGYYQFVTFRTFDSVDEFIRKWGFNPAMSNKEKQLRIDEYLDTSTNGAYLKGDILKYLFEFLIAQDKKLYELVAFAIMNNHVHILFKPLESLNKVMQRVKGVSAKKINELLARRGKFWADDYYDKAIRDERYFWVVYEYIKNNPLKIDNCGTEVPLPSKCGVETLLPKSGAKAPLLRFYGVYE